MNKKMTPHDFRASLNRRLSGLTADSFLAQRIIAEEKKMTVSKKRPALLILVAVLLFVLVAGALAYALNVFGIVDFAGRQANTFVPPQYEACIVQLNQPIDTAFGNATLQEAYYDGQVLRLTAHIVPKGKILLIGGNVSLSDPMDRSFDGAESPGMTIAQCARQYYEGQLYEVNLRAGENETCVLMPHEDGSVTLYLECIFEDVQACREMNVELIGIPIRVDGNDVGTYDFSGRENVSVKISFHASETKVYTCHDEMKFPEAGVKVCGVEMTVTPLEIRYTLEYEVVDLEAFSAQQGGLWFDFVHADDGVYQSVSSGLYSSESCGRADGAFFAPDEEGTVYRQTGAVGLDNLSDHYTIQAYNAWEKTRYEIHSFEVKENNK